MKNLFYTTLVLTLGLFSSANLNGQVTCKEDPTVQLSPWSGLYTFLAQDLFEGASNSDVFNVTPTTVDCSDVGSPVTVVATLTDSDGTTYDCETTVTVLDLVPPVVISHISLQVALSLDGTAMIFPETVDNGSYDNCSGNDNITLEISQSLFTCEDIGENQVTLTATDEFGNYNSSVTTIIVEDKLGGEVTCYSGVDIDLSNGPVTMYPSDVVSSYTGVCFEGLELTLYNGNQIIPFNTVNPELLGLTILAEVVTPDGNTCSSLITVGGVLEEFIVCDTACWSTPLTDCDGGHTDSDNIEWPCDIDLFAIGATPEDLTPDNLVDIFNVHQMDSEPTIINYANGIVGMNYEDQVIEIGGPNDELFKIIRTWTVVDWITASFYTYNQIITNTDFTNNSVVCDTLSRSTPLGDCESKHTEVDVVEWPDDLIISDPRFSPNDLVLYSNVDSLDAWPSFYHFLGTTFSAQYLDYIIDNSENTVTIGRTWTISSSDSQWIGASWSYTQEILINTNNFNDLVIVETSTGRPVPQVQLTPDQETNDQGTAVINDPMQDINPYKQDTDANGLNILDMTLIYQHLLNTSQLENEGQILAADLNRDQSVTALDVIELRKVILDIGNLNSNPWIFLDKTNDAPYVSRANYLAVKLGDIDDSAALNNINNEENISSLYFNDLVLNAGQTYQIPIFLNDAESMLGYEIHFSYNQENLEVNQVSSSLFTEDLSTRIDNGIISIISNNEEQLVEQINSPENEALVYIEVSAKQNTVLSWSMSFSNSRNSYLVDEELNLIYLNGSINGEIISGLKDLDVNQIALKIYPNPADQMTQISIPGKLGDEINLAYIVSNNGQIVQLPVSRNHVDVSSLAVGNYVIMVNNQDQWFRNRLSVVR